MKIIKLAIENLQKRMNCDITFHEDINIITGANGTGKTTVIKILWYLVSGNIERIFREVEFSYLHIHTSTYKVSISISDGVVAILTKINDEETEYLFYEDEIKNSRRSSARRRNDKDFPNHDIDDINRVLINLSPGSVFFPTFRRIEGGYSLTENTLSTTYDDISESIQTGLHSLSSKLSVDNNLFVSAISTNDIIDLLRRKHSEASEEVNLLHIGMSEFIEKKINSIKANTPSKVKDQILNDIQMKVMSITNERETHLSAFSTLSSLISQIYKHKGIKFTDQFNVGSTETAISSTKMSAGEKQLLSFICYNAFFNSSPFIIDEPELSLHIDWQRNLLPILKSQKTNNQIIIATHSPFIYAKYPNKEIVLS